jgi:hypothetical protein
MRTRLVAIGMLLLLSAVAMTAGQNGNDLYQQGLAREVAGDLKGAIQIFERLVRDSSNRTLTAKALLQLGRWSDLLGDDQARKYYERVIREFADQKEPASEARTRLDALVKVANPNTSPARRLAIDWAGWSRQINGGSLTRDGRHWLRYNGEQRAVELVEIGTNNVRRLTAEGPNPAEAGVGVVHLSNDGRKVAATVAIRKPGSAAPFEFERGELRVFDVGGRGPGRVLTTWDDRVLRRSRTAVQPFDWAPRDDRIWLFVMRSDQSAQIASVDMNGNLEVLKTLTWRNDTQAPSLSPDGRFLAYDDVTDRQSPHDVYILATDGSGEQRIEHPADDSKPMFLPDGSGIVFVSNRRDVQDLWFLPVADGRPSGQPRLVWRGPAGFGTVDRFADNGSLFYYFYTNANGTYTVPVNPAAGAVGELTRIAPVLGEPNSGAAFSPDGRYLAHFRGAFAGRVVIRELATGLDREFSFGAPLGEGSIRWCTGDSLMATGYFRGAEAYRVNIKDGSVQRLPIIPNTAVAPLCVAGGEEIIYVPSATAIDQRSVVRRSLASGTETILFEGPVLTLTGSADGKQLALLTVNPKGDAARVVTMSAAGGNTSADLLTSPGIRVGNQFYTGLHDVAWMPSGDRLLVLLADEPPSQTRQWRIAIWEVPLTGAPRKIGLLPLPKVQGYFFGVRSFTIHPEGKLIAFQSHEGVVEQSWAIDNFFQFIKAGGGWQQ